MWCDFPRDLKPDPDARSKSRQQIFMRRAARFKGCMGIDLGETELVWCIISPDEGDVIGG